MSAAKAGTFKEAIYRESRRDRANNRFLAACRTLATVRKLAAPSTRISVNLAQQNNTIGATAGVVQAIGAGASGTLEQTMA